MTPSPYIILALRLSMGWLFLYDGLSKILDKAWSAAPLLSQAQFLPEFFAWFADPSRIGIVNILNSWGLLILGALLILGIRIRFVTILGIVLMILYYLLSLDFPIASGAGWIMDRHIIYIFVLMLLYSARAGDFWGLDHKLVIQIKD